MDILGQMNVIKIDPMFNLESVFKFASILILLAALFYAFLLVLRVKIVIDTVQSDANPTMKALAYANLLISIVISVLGTIIIVFI
ncbi:hypothetical protein GX888_00320 [Candidatus Dojkabacteria bacterium]|uniref:Uncharacterized protein n=1 Tax=Candidatus Dojkabacteria bacterium TaxID=2099670 RepID=A0A847VCF2_9BACT|nr:hypothetical protein [Candidatus Dojkabacteria bacterium]